MTALNKCALRQLAEKAGGEEWQSRKEPGIGSEYTVIVKGSLKKNQGWSTCRPVADQVVNKKTMDFISAANPAAVLALLDDLETAEKRIAEHRKVLNSLAAVARRYLPDYDEHPEIQAADELLQSTAGIGVKGD